LCFGWIDGIRKNRDENSYTIRFTPRKPGSTWSRVNIKRVAKLSRAGLMTPTGLHAFERRDEEKTKLYSHETKIQKTERGARKKIQIEQTGMGIFPSPGVHVPKDRDTLGRKREARRNERQAVRDIDSGFRAR